MIAKGFADSDISEITGFPEERIRQLREYH
jgi:hypothetical protein